MSQPEPGALPCPPALPEPCHAAGNSTGERGEALRKSSGQDRVRSVMQKETRKHAACGPLQSGPCLCWAAGALAVTAYAALAILAARGPPEAEKSGAAAEAAGWSPPAEALDLLLLRITRREKTRCDKRTLKRNPKGGRDIGGLVKKPTAIWKAETMPASVREGHLWGRAGCLQLAERGGRMGAGWWAALPWHWHWHQRAKGRRAGFPFQGLQGTAESKRIASC